MLPAFTKEEYDVIFTTDYHFGTGSYGAQSFTHNQENDTYKIEIITHSQFKPLTKTRKEIILEAMKSSGGRDILIDKDILQDYYSGFDKELENKAIDIPTYNDGLSFFVDSLTDDEINNLQESFYRTATWDDIDKEQLAIKNFEVINLWT